MKDYRPNGCRMYVAVKDIDFPPFDDGEEGLHVSKGDVWMLKQITFSGKIWLNKKCTDEDILQISSEQLESDFVEVNLKELDMRTFYEFSDNENGYGELCTETVMINDYIYSSDTYEWSFESFCRYNNYPY